jgi:hypothetical protein
MQIKNFLVSLVTVLAVLAGAGSVHAQTGTVIVTGANLPTDCTVGLLFYKTGASDGLYTCTATDTWTAVGTGSVSDTAYDAATWDSVTTVAPSKNAVRDKIEAIVAGGGLGTTDIDTSAELRAIVGDESGTGALIFAGGNIGAATATSFTATTIDTGQGANELFDMDQNVLVASSPTFAALTVDTEVYDATGWDADLTVPTKDAIRDKIEAIVAGGGLGTTDIDTSAELRAIVGDESGTGALIFAGGNIGAATATTLDTGQGANELFDMDQHVLTTSSPTFVAVSVDAEAYDATGWNGDLTVATKDDIRDKIEAVVAGGGLGTADIDTSAELRAIVGDESGTGALLFAGGNIGAATGTSLAFGSDPADAGVIRFENATGLAWEAATPGTDLTLVMNGSNVLVSSAPIQVSTEAYDDAGWDGDLTVPTKDAIRDELETFPTLTDPDADRLIFWDDSAGNIVALTSPSIFSISSTTLAVTIPKSYYFRLAACQNTTASVGVDVFTSGGATATCVTGTNATRAVLDFANSGVVAVQGGFRLPPSYSGVVLANMKWRTSATSGDVVWQIATACTADAEVFDDTFNTASEVTDTAKGTTLQLNDAQIASVDVTGCAAGEHLQWRLFRDAGHASDNLAATAQLVDVEFRVLEVF